MGYIAIKEQEFTTEKPAPVCEELTNNMETESEDQQTVFYGEPWVFHITRPQQQYYHSTHQFIYESEPEQFEKSKPIRKQTRKRRKKQKTNEENIIMKLNTKIKELQEHIQYLNNQYRQSIFNKQTQQKDCNDNSTNASLDRKHSEPKSYYNANWEESESEIQPQFSILEIKKPVNEHDEYYQKSWIFLGLSMLQIAATLTPTFYNTVIIKPDKMYSFELLNKIVPNEKQEWEMCLIDENESLSKNQLKMGNFSYKVKEKQDQLEYKQTRKIRFQFDQELLMEFMKAFLAKSYVIF